MRKLLAALLLLGCLSAVTVAGDVPFPPAPPPPPQCQQNCNQSVPVTTTSAIFHAVLRLLFR